MLTNQNNKNEISGVVGFFDTPGELIKATEKVRDANYESFDCYTPYPVHGLEHAQGLKPSFIPWVTFICGITGTTLAFTFEYWTSAVDWAVNVSGKPFNSWQAFVPVMFELTVLFAALSSVAAMFILNGLPNLKKKSVSTSLTKDRFAIMVDAPSGPSDAQLAEMDEDDQIKWKKKRSKYKKFDSSEVEQFLKQVGAKDVSQVSPESWF
jgi:hypothetical protein